EVEYRQIGNELPVLLRIAGVDIIVPDDLDAGGCKLRQVEVVLRGIAREIPCCAEMMAEVDQSLVAIACNINLGRAVTRRRNPDLRGEPIDEREVEVDEAGPWPLDDVPKPRQHAVDERCARVRLGNRKQVLTPPILPVIYLDVENRSPRASAVKN